jgi:hypothetical protein
MIVPTLALACALAAAGFAVGRRSGALWLWSIAVVAAMPALAYVGYYAHLVSEPVALYQLRAVPGTELLAAGVGYLGGFIAARAGVRGRRLGLAMGALVALVSLGVLLIPYAKPLVTPPDWGRFRSRWDGPVAMQTTPSSCGPATAATLLKALGTDVTERQLAEESFTSASGTENWYLARAIRSHGRRAEFVSSTSILPSSIAGVSGPGWGHYIAIVSKNGDSYLVGDPLIGARTYTEAQLRKRYRFTGFYLEVR